jgi:hypothetical protein
MRDEASLRRLAEMGVDVYLPRAAMRAVAEPPAFATDAQAHESMQQARPADAAAVLDAPTAAPAVLLLADVQSPLAGKLLGDVARALRFARIACVPARTRDEAELGTAVGLVMFGEAQARAVGAVLPAERQREMGWVVGAGLSALSVDATAKRALWSELRRMTREMAKARRPVLAAAVAGAAHRGY